MADLTVSGLRVLLAVVEDGSFTAAAGRLGYSQSAISRQIGALELAAGQALFDRHRSGASLTAAGSRLVPRARHIINELETALADVQFTPSGRVRLGTFPIAAATIIPDALVQLRAAHPELIVALREATTPALVRSIRAGTLDLALVAQSPPFRPLDPESPALDVATLVERDLVVAVGVDHPLAHRGSVDVDELNGQVWVASTSEGSDLLMGVWPGLGERADVRYVVRDWLAKLRLVAAGLAVTTVAPSLAGRLPTGVNLVAVRGEPLETRRLSLIRLAGPIAPEVAATADALRAIISRTG